MNPVDLYRSQFESLNGCVPTWVERLRRDGLARFTELGFPTTRLEDWKYTDVAPIAGVPFRLAPAADRAEAAKGLVDRMAYGSGPRLVFVNGRYSEALSSVESLPKGVRAESLARAFARDGDAIEPYMGRLAERTTQSFTALNTAFLHDGAFIHLPAGTVISEPIQLLFLSTPPAGVPCVSHPRVLIVAGKNSEAAVVEDHCGVGSSYFTNAVTEIVLEDGARIDHYKVQREGEGGFHVATVEALQGRDTRFRSYAASLGGALARVAINTKLDAEGGECVLDGLYMASGRQHVDHHTTIDHRQPRCSSRELYKGVLDGNATGVFNGRVYVRPNAQKSDAMQMNKNLLLSDAAVVDTKPQLEIFADDVKCSHGATIGRLDDTALFYLRSRGIDPRTARDLLIRGFANELVGRLAAAPVRAQVQAALAERWGWTSEMEMHA